MNDRRLAIVLTDNGLGHWNRAAAIIARCLWRGARFDSIHVIGEQWQRELTASDSATRTLVAAGAEWVPAVASPGVGWSRSPGDFDDGRLLAWQRRAAACPELVHADLVLSDNLVGVLEVRPDAVLSGNFLWSDVLGDAYPDAEPVTAFVRAERDLLTDLSPPMLCVRDLAMPGVLERTHAVPVGWMVRHRGALREPGGIGVLVGRAAPHHYVAGLVAALVERIGTTVWVAEHLDLDPRPARVRVFDYSPTAWARLETVVCQAGVGTLTDSVGYGIPIVALGDEANSELDHNARRVAALGLGRAVSGRPSADELVGSVDEVLHARAPEIRSRIAGLDTGGLDAAAEWLCAHWNIELSPRRPDPEHV